MDIQYDQIAFKEWIGQPPRQRIDWYRANIASLLNYLRGKKAFSVVEMIVSKQLLEGITARAKIDIRYAKSEQPAPDDRSYYDTIARVLSLLPIENSDRDDWIPQVRESLKVIKQMEREFFESE